MQVHLHVVTLCKEISDELEHVVQTALEDLLVQTCTLGHGCIVRLDCGTHDQVQTVLDLLLGCLVLQLMLLEKVF